MEFGIINAFDLKSVSVANVFFTNDDESDSVVVSIVFAANAYSREDLSLYNEQTNSDALKTNLNTYQAFNKWLNIIFKNPKEFSDYTIDIGNRENKKLTLSILSDIYNRSYWQYNFETQKKLGAEYSPSFMSNLKSTSGDGASTTLPEDLSMISELTNVFETYSFFFFFNEKKGIEEFKNLFKLN